MAFLNCIVQFVVATSEPLFPDRCQFCELDDLPIATLSISCIRVVLYTHKTNFYFFDKSKNKKNKVND